MLASSLVAPVAISALEKAHDYVYLTGGVKFPGRYPLSKDLRLSTLIEQAGGIKKQAPGNRVRIKIIDSDYHAITLDFRHIKDGRQKDLFLQGNDKVVVLD